MAYTAYRSLWYAKIGYVFPVMTFTRKQCTEIAAPFLMQILPAMGFHCHTPGSVLYGPRLYGGQSLMNLYTEQGISGIKTLIGHLRSHNKVSCILLILLSYIQLIAETQAHYLKKCSPPLPYVPFSWLEHLRTFLLTFKGFLIIPDIWSPYPPRKNGVFLMDTILHYTDKDPPTPFELYQFNECRLYCHAIFLLYNDIRWLLYY